MFKATEAEMKIRETNLLINMQINLFLCRTSQHYFLLSLQQLLWDQLGIKNASTTHAQNVRRVNKLGQQKRCGRNHIMHFLKQYKLIHWVNPYHNRESGNPQQTIPVVHKIIFKQIVEMLFQCF